ncbi:MAG: hypothetical protein HY243_15390 [Proteobacteria bacterium]|nr:hypothetical protein [Pseudomonadota bacterium]
MLKQGLVITPDTRYPSAKERAEYRKHGVVVFEKLEHPNKKFPEIDCLKDGDTLNCTALFLETDERGWRNYVVVAVDLKNLTVVNADYPSTSDALPSIPGPVARDVPKLQGSYLKARGTLRALGFKPARNRDHDNWARICFDDDCNRSVTLPEAQCSGTGMSFCTAYWISPNKRVLRITTIGERDPDIYFMEWSTWKNFKKDLEQ